MVRLYLNSVFFYDDTGDPGWGPEDPLNFKLAGMAFVSSEPGGPADALDFEVCTPRWLADNFSRAIQAQPPRHVAGVFWSTDRKVLFGRGIISVERWSRQAIHHAIAEIIDNIQAPTWQIAAERAGRILPWEFDYKYDAKTDQSAVE